TAGRRAGGPDRRDRPAAATPSVAGGGSCAEPVCVGRWRSRCAWAGGGAGVRGPVAEPVRVPGCGAAGGPGRLGAPVDPLPSGAVEGLMRGARRVGRAIGRAAAQLRRALTGAGPLPTIWYHPSYRLPLAPVETRWGLEPRRADLV